MHTPEISVILAIYSVEKYLVRCVESILKQDFDDYEVIFVDDGSPDDSYRICEEYVKKDKRFHLIRKPNGGLVSARRTGLEHARGNWIYLLDADDDLQEHAFRTLWEQAQKGYDIVKGAHYRIYRNRQEPQVFKEDNLEITGPGQFLQGLINGDFPKYLWCSLYKRSLFCPERMREYEWASIGEDYLTLLSISARVQRMLCVNTVVQNYYINESSIMQTRVFSNGYSDKIDELVEKYMGEHASAFKDTLYLKRMEGYIRNFFVPELPFDKERYRIVKTYLHDPQHWELVKQKTDPKYLKFFSCFPLYYLYSRMYNLMLKKIRLKGIVRKVL